MFVSVLFEKHGSRSNNKTFIVKARIVATWHQRRSTDNTDNNCQVVSHLSETCATDDLFAERTVSSLASRNVRPCCPWNLQGNFGSRC